MSTTQSDGHGVHMAFPRDGRRFFPVPRPRGGMWFSIGGTAPPALMPMFAVLSRMEDKGNVEVAYGNMYRSPVDRMDGDDPQKVRPREWGICFHLGAASVSPAAQYSLSVYRLGRGGERMELARAERLTFPRRSGSQDDQIGGTGTRRVQVAYPSSADDQCRDGVYPYGDYDEVEDTSILRVELLDDAGTVIATDNNPYFDFGTWTAAFSNLNLTVGRSYSIRVIGNETTGVGDPFMIVDC